MKRFLIEVEDLSMSAKASEVLGVAEPNITVVPRMNDDTRNH